MTINPVPPSPEKVGNFILHDSILACNAIPVSRYASEKTGLNVIIANIEGPLVSGYFALATEAKDNDGCPHTLEHLIFLGSEKYPYKGILDLLANRCFASGTNAWTDVNHTCYTSVTAGDEGFLTLMPIYLDHVFYPTLTDSGFITEVYHINGEGRDAGVVFAEMQAVENTAEELTQNNLLIKMYPGDSGYKSMTGGALKNLRESTCISKIRAYHTEFYRPENCFVIITGSICPTKVLEALAPVEENIISKGDRGPYQRPWQKEIPPLVESSVTIIPYPSDEETTGLVSVAWRGPELIKSFYEVNACTLLLKYLTDTSVSPLPKVFVDIPDPYATEVVYSVTEYSETLLTIEFLSVPVAKLSLIKDKLDISLLEIAEASLDLERLKTIIQKYRLENLSTLETSPHDLMANSLISFMLYGSTKEEFWNRLNSLELVEKLEQEPEEFWIEILRKYFINGKSVTVIGSPSVEQQHKIANEEENRVKARLKKYGHKGLSNLEKIVLDATVKNDIAPPNEIFSSIPSPSLESIKFFFVKSYTSNSQTVDPRFDFSKVPVNMHLTDLNTNLVYVSVLLDSSTLDSKLRPYIPLLCSCLLQSPIKKDGILIPYEDVIKQLEKDTIEHFMGVGLSETSYFECGAFSSTLLLQIKVEPKKYAKGIQWIQDILFNTIFTNERVEILAKQILHDIPKYKRDGKNVVKSLINGIIYEPNNNKHATNFLIQQTFLENVLANLKDSTAIISDLESVRKSIVDPKKITINLAANLNTLSSLNDNIADPWENVIPSYFERSKCQLNVVPDSALLKSQFKESCVAGLGAVESAFLYQTCPCTIDYNHPDYASIQVFIQYLTQLEGPMWKKVRGKGLAYSIFMEVLPSTGTLRFMLFRASNVVGAYKESKEIIEQCLKPNPVWDENLFASAKSSLMLHIAENEKSINDVVHDRLVSHFKKIDENYNKNMIHQILNVTVNDVENIIPKYIKPLFNTKVTKTAVVCHPSKVKEISKSLNKLGLNTTPYSNFEQCFVNLW